MKLLIISHNAFSNTNNMGKTMTALFHDFNSNEIAQLYFHLYSTGIDNCCNSYQITDIDVIKSIIFRKKCGRVISADVCENPKYKDIKSKLFEYARGHNPLKLFIRDFVWKIGSWKTDALFNWIEDFNPTHIFFASGNSIFSYDIALTLSRRYNIPLITYFCDDYYNENINSVSPLYWLRKYIFRRKVREIVKVSKELIFISKSMETEYAKIFKKQGHTIMTPSNNHTNGLKMQSKPIVMSYIGNVFLGRWEVLVKIAKAVNNINKNGIKIIFEVYSGNATDKIINALNFNGNNFYKGKLSAKGVKEKIMSSDVLLHVESFKKRFIEKTKHSISTKIADCLASNRVILAVGPIGIASIDYLKDNKAAYIIDNESKIEDKLIEYFVENNIDINIIRNAKNLAQKNHNIEKNSQTLRRIFENMVR